MATAVPQASTTQTSTTDSALTKSIGNRENSPKLGKSVEIAVPGESPSVEEAIRLALSQDATKAVINLAAEFVEPRMPWPLELSITGGLHTLMVIGDPGSGAAVRDVALCAAGPPGEGPSVMLQGVVVQGSASLEGAGCTLENCEVRRGVEIGFSGAASVRGCKLRGRSVGIVVSGPALLEENTIELCDTGISLLANPAAVLCKNKLLSSRAAAITMQFFLPAEVESSLCLEPKIDVSDNQLEGIRPFDISLMVGSAAFAFDVWPLPVGLHTATGSKGRKVEIEVTQDGTIKVVQAPSRAPEKKRKRKNAPASEQEKAEVEVGPLWAYGILGLDSAGLTGEKLRGAYRKRALELHPDKMRDPSGDSLQKNMDFHKLTEAYEALCPFVRTGKSDKSKKLEKRHQHRQDGPKKQRQKAKASAPRTSVS
eukprot:gnl/MRDRNA2_/MRDRNA2_34554_c0_seq1.p1 gnl/MRDRNA2_/MRDRNA2_34554_c0~~gnl/MRDRNA2_/MRDRNA2_34554_c0_seq1.p1  ORF type:complete len:426 (-),score=98.33 gnl/MRDRNA2_/MRDRNA2_34554_c0_seq1:44-1321(-)